MKKCVKNEKWKKKQDMKRIRKMKFKTPKKKAESQKQKLSVNYRKLWKTAQKIQK